MCKIICYLVMPKTDILKEVIVMKEFEVPSVPRKEDTLTVARYDNEPGSEAQADVFDVVFDLDASIIEVWAKANSTIPAAGFKRYFVGCGWKVWG